MESTMKEEESALQMGNVTWATGEEPYSADMELYMTSYTVVSTIIYTLICVTGLVGNTVLIYAVYKSKTLHTSTYTYLVSDSAQMMGQTIKLCGDLIIDAPFKISQACNFYLSRCLSLRRIYWL